MRRLTLRSRRPARKAGQAPQLHVRALAVDMTRFNEVGDLDRAGDHDAAMALLTQLGAEKDPMALIELGCRYFSQDGCWPKVKTFPTNEQAGLKLMEEGRRELERLAQDGDGEAMRMLAYTHLGLLGVFEKDISRGEKLLLEAFEAGCYFAANDLHVLYLGSDDEKSKFHYNAAESHGCRVVFNSKFEP